MTYRLNETQGDLLGQLVPNKNVLDLGAGYELEFSKDMLHRGAASVHAVDKAPTHQFTDPKFTFTHSIFSEFYDSLDPHHRFEMILLSWPACYPGIKMTMLVEMANTVIYVGNTLDSNMCGDPYLWEHLKERVVRHYEPSQRNSMIVYGQEQVTREALPEETAGLKSWDINFPPIQYSDIDFTKVSRDLERSQRNEHATPSPREY